MGKKIYFAGSIRGGRGDAELYRRLVERMGREHTVLTEHVGDPALRETAADVWIRARDMAWLREADLVIAECSTPSLGVGYELAFARLMGKPCHLLWNEGRTQLSAMLTGDGHYRLHPYTDEAGCMAALEEILTEETRGEVQTDVEK